MTALVDPVAGPTVAAAPGQRAPTSVPDAATPVTPDPGARSAPREAFLDVVRSIATCRVVLWHAYGAPFLSYLVASMPAMFFVAGSLLAASLDRRPARQVVEDRLRRLLVPFWVFGAFAWLVLAVSRVRVGGSATEAGMARVLPWLLPLADPRGTAWEGGWLAQPLWYLRCFVWLLLAAPLLRRALRRFPRALFVPPVLGVFVMDWWVRHPASAPPGFATWRWYLGDFCLYSIFLLLGFHHRGGAFRHLSRRDTVEWAMIAAVAAVLWCTTQPLLGGVVNNSYPAHLLVGMAWLFVFLALETRLTRLPELRYVGGVVRWLTQRSLSVYLWHTTAIVIGYWLLDRFAPGAPRLALIPLLVVLVPALVTCTGWAEDLAARRRPRLWPLPPPRWWRWRLPEWPAATRRLAGAADRRVVWGAVAGIGIVAMALTLVASPLPGTASADAATSGSTTGRKAPAPSARPDTAVFDDGGTGTATGEGTAATTGGTTVTTAKTTRTTTAGTAAGGATAGAALTPTSWSAMPTAKAAKLQSALDAWTRANEVEGLQVSVGLPDGARWSVGRGAIGADSEIQITSVTKTFTGAMVLQLVREGKIGLDDHLPRLDAVPDFPYGDQITVRQLLDHTSGLDTYQESAAFKADPTMALTPAEAVALGATLPLQWTPGTNSGYSSSGYLLLGVLAEQLGGASYEEQLQRRFFGPLRLTHTRLDDAPVDGWIGWSTGGIVSTTDDLDTWAAALYRDGTVLGPDLTREMLNIDNTWSVGLGAWPLCPCSKADDGTKQYTSIGHHGGSGMVEWSPKDDLVIAGFLDEPIFGARLTQQDLGQLFADLRTAAA